MKKTIRNWVSRLPVILAASVLAPSQLPAAKVLVLSSENYDQDQKIVQVLEAGGHSVTLGSSFSNLGLGVPLQEFNAVVFQINHNYNARDMSAPAQTYLRNFVQGGGGLITVGWLNYARYYGKLALLEPILPTTPRYDWDSRPSITYTADTADAVLNAGLPASFSFAATSIGGTEEVSVLKPGATRYYQTDNNDTLIGVGGWTSGSGEVLSFAAMAGVASLNDPNFARLLGNAATKVAGTVPTAKLYVGLGVYVAPKIIVKRRSLTTTKRIYTLKGRVKGYFPIRRVEVKGAKGGFKPAKGRAGWSKTLALKKGVNRFTVRAIDKQNFVSSPVKVTIRAK